MSDDLEADGDGSVDELSESIDRRPEGRLWREYDHLTALYRFYLDLLLKTILAFFVITGTVMTLVLANRGEQPAIDWALIPVIGFSGVLAVGSARCQKTRPRG